MAEPTGVDVLLDVLRSEGVTHLFGNPGSTELPLMDALADTGDFDYVLALQEATAVAAAEGYARVTGRPAFLNLHTSAGLGNAIGNLTNAQANRTPLVVTAGQQDYRHIVEDPLLSGNLVGIATAVSKWATEVRTVDDIGPITRRAFQDAASPPTGPVFFSLPMDLLDQRASSPAPPATVVERRVVAGRLEELAELLASTPIGKLGLVIGDEVSASGAVGEAVALAEALGAPVHGQSLHATGVFPQAHPLYADTFAPAAPAIAKALAGYDRVFLIGSHGFVVYPYQPGPPVPAHVELLQLTPDPTALGRYGAPRLALLGDPKATLGALVPLVAARTDRDAVGRAIEERGRAREAAMAQAERLAESRYDASPTDPMAAAHALLRASPARAPVVDEAITTGFYVRRFHHGSSPDRYFFCKGGGLGWGMPFALGVSLGLGGEQTLAAVGDGAAMYSCQALWTAAHRNLPVVFAVFNNRQYLILKNNLRGMDGRSVAKGNFVAMDLDSPAVDYVGLARSLGVDGTLVERASDIGEAARAAFESGRPHLLEIPVAAP
ncbi:MAG: thiamine pyrophosphate-binding protein [Acidimicrobiia bacterium]|nr:thiamine pyrophosphate-binding protein [Acidimicrobiia bacterium]